ncbi:hypothetical protein KC331_g6246 [Hortaea werneckii]|nr:hypothetical protein KC331_g6246 [Hortaea werneckii]
MISTRQWINLLTTAFLLVLPTGSVAAALTTSFSSCPATLTLTEYSPENPSDFPRQQQSPTETGINKDPHALSASCPGLILSTTTLFGTSTPPSPDSVAGTAGPASTDRTARLPNPFSSEQGPPAGVAESGTLALVTVTLTQTAARSTGAALVSFSTSASSTFSAASTSSTPSASPTSSPASSFASIGEQEAGSVEVTSITLTTTARRNTVSISGTGSEDGGLDTGEVSRSSPADPQTSTLEGPSSIATSTSQGIVRSSHSAGVSSPNSRPTPTSVQTSTLSQPGSVLSVHSSIGTTSTTLRSSQSEHSTTSRSGSESLSVPGRPSTEQHTSSIHDDLTGSTRLPAEPTHSPASSNSSIGSPVFSSTHTSSDSRAIGPSLASSLSNTSIVDSGRQPDLPPPSLNSSKTVEGSGIGSTFKPPASSFESAETLYSPGFPETIVPLPASLQSPPIGSQPFPAPPSSTLGPFASPAPKTGATGFPVLTSSSSTVPFPLLSTSLPEPSPPPAASAPPPWTFKPGQQTVIGGTTLSFDDNSSVYIHSWPAPISAVFPGGIIPTDTAGLDWPQLSTRWTPAAFTKQWNDEMKTRTCKPPCLQSPPPLILASPQTVQFWNITTGLCKVLSGVTYSTQTTIKPPPVTKYQLDFQLVKIPKEMLPSVFVIPAYAPSVTTQPPFTIHVAPGVTGCPFPTGRRIARDNTCGGGVTPKYCPDMQCCAADATCGTDRAHCAEGCDARFGSCWSDGVPFLKPADVFGANSDGQGVPPGAPGNDVLTIDPPEGGRGVIFEPFAYCWDCKEDHTVWPPLPDGDGLAPFPHGFHAGGGGCLFGLCHVDWPSVSFCICGTPGWPKIPGFPKPPEISFPGPPGGDHHDGDDDEGGDDDDGDDDDGDDDDGGDDDDDHNGGGGGGGGGSPGKPGKPDKPGKPGDPANPDHPKESPTPTSRSTSSSASCDEDEVETATDITYSCFSQGSTITSGTLTITPFSTCTASRSKVKSGCRITATTTKVWETASACPALNLDPSVYNDQGDDEEEAPTCPANIEASPDDDQGQDGEIVSACSFQANITTAPCSTRTVTNTIMICNQMNDTEGLSTSRSCYRNTTQLSTGPCALATVTTSFAVACPYKNQMTIEPILLTPTYVPMTARPTHTIGTSKQGDTLSCGDLGSGQKKLHKLGSALKPRADSTQHPVFCVWTPRTKSNARVDASISTELSRMDDMLDNIGLIVAGARMHSDYQSLQGVWSSVFDRETKAAAELSSVHSILAKESNHGGLSSAVESLSSKIIGLEEEESSLSAKLATRKTKPTTTFTPTTSECLKYCTLPEDPNFGICKLHIVGGAGDYTTSCQCDRPASSVPLYTICGNIGCPNQPDFCVTETGPCTPPRSVGVGWCVLKKTITKLWQQPVSLKTYCDCVHAGTTLSPTDTACGTPVCPNQMASEYGHGHTFWGWGVTELPAFEPVFSHMSLASTGNYGTCHSPLSQSGYGDCSLVEQVMRCTLSTACVCPDMDLHLQAPSLTTLCGTAMCINQVASSPAVTPSSCSTVHDPAAGRRMFARGAGGWEVEYDGMAKPGATPESPPVSTGV